MKLLVALGFTIALFELVRRRLLQVDLSLFWFLGIVLLTIFSISDRFIFWVADLLGIIEPPLAIILLALFFMLGLITVLAIALTRLRRQQIMLVRQMAQFELARQMTEKRS